MAEEQPGNDVEIQQRQPQPVVSIRATVRIVDLAEHQGDRLSALSGYLQQRGAQPAGPPFVRYHTFEGTETDLEVGIPVVAPVADEGRIAGGALPGGPAVTTWHIGSHDTLGDAYARLDAWLNKHGRAPAGIAAPQPGPTPQAGARSSSSRSRKPGLANAAPAASSPMVAGSTVHHARSWTARSATGRSGRAARWLRSWSHAVRCSTGTSTREPHHPRKE